MFMDIALVQPKGYINIGSVARLLENFPVGKLVIINPPKSYKCLTTRKYALRGYHYVNNAKIYNSVEELKKDYSLIIGTTARIAREKHLLRRTVPLKTAIRKAMRNNSVILFGNEARGLLNKDIEQCHLLTTIPASRYNTLNLSHAVAIVLFFAWIMRTERNNQAVDQEKINKLLELIQGIIDKLGFNKGEKEKTQQRLWKSMLSRTDLTEAEIRALFGFFKRLENVLK